MLVRSAGTIAAVLAAAWLAPCLGRANAAPPRRTVLHTFTGGLDGNGARVALLAAAPGLVYGVNAGAGAFGACCGSVFRMTKTSVPGEDWPVETLHRFEPGALGNRPAAATPVLGADGALYGTAANGGPSDGGVVWRLAPPPGGSGAWTYQVLHAFDANRQRLGWRPQFGLVADTLGALFGLAGGGANGTGVVFRLAPPGPGETAWSETILLDLPAAPAGGTVVPSAGLTLSPDGSSLFGAYGVRNYPDPGSATVWRLARATTATGWSAAGGYTLPHYGDFAPLLTSGMNLFSIYFRDGVDAFAKSGAIVELTPPPQPSSAAWTERDLYGFDNAAPVYGNLALDHGRLYGTIALTYGEPPDAIFSLTEPVFGGGLWEFQTVSLFSPDALTHPIVPYGLVAERSGNLFGVALAGGARQKGVVFRQEVVRHGP